MYLIPYPGGEIKVALAPLRTNSAVGSYLVPSFSFRHMYSKLFSYLFFLWSFNRNRDMGWVLSSSKGKF